MDSAQIILYLLGHSISFKTYFCSTMYTDYLNTKISLFNSSFYILPVIVCQI